MNIPQHIQEKIDKLNGLAFRIRRISKRTAISCANLVHFAKRRNYACLTDDGIKRIDKLLSLTIEQVERIDA